MYFKYFFMFLGDKVLVAIKGQKKKAVIIGCKQKQKPLIPKFDSNNIVLIEDNGNSLLKCIHNFKLHNKF